VKAWRRDGEKLICEHGTFELPISCPICAQQPDDDDDDVADEPLPPAPEGCFSLEQHEAWFGALADKARDTANEIADSDPPAADGEDGNSVRWNYSLMAKLWETAIKARRAAAEFAAVRERRAFVMQREKRILDRDRARRTFAQP
jgi:hypothetical protein